MLDHVVDLPLRVGCRLQRHNPVPSVSQLSLDYACLVYSRLV